LNSVFHRMNFSVFDDSVSYTMNVFLVIGNIINLVYNIPQIVKTYKTKSTKDFSSTFLFMRVFGNTIWLAYSIELNTFLFLLCNIVSVGSSIFISYYKVIELYDYYKKKKYININNTEEIDMFHGTVSYVDKSTNTEQNEIEMISEVEAAKTSETVFERTSKEAIERAIEQILASLSEAEATRVIESEATMSNEIVLKTTEEAILSSETSSQTSSEANTVIIKTDTDSYNTDESESISLRSITSEHNLLGVL
jgi:uncharacterized protein with PQ loop repeat